MKGNSTNMYIKNKQQKNSPKKIIYIYMSIRIRLGGGGEVLPPPPNLLRNLGRGLSTPCPPTPPPPPPPPLSTATLLIGTWAYRYVGL